MGSALYGLLSICPHRSRWLYWNADSQSGAERKQALTCINTERQTSRAVRRVLSPGCLAAAGETAIHLGPALPPVSCGLPADSGGQPSNVRAGPPVTKRPLLTLLQVGFT